MTFVNLVPFRGKNRNPLARIEHQNSPFFALQSSMNSLFDDFFRGFPGEALTTAESFSPKMAIDVKDEEIEITAELPGVKKQDLDISIADNIMTISGEKKTETEQEEKNFYRSEISYGSFSKSVQLPEGTEEDKIDASLNDGILTVKIPKSQPQEPEKKKIDIK